MSIKSIHLRKILRLMFADPADLKSSLRSDIREDIAREQGLEQAGGDFYGPFWRDAKDHVFGLADLRDSTKARIESNPRRANLYPKLRDGFLIWWDEKRRWTNEPFFQGDSPKGSFYLSDLDATVKVDNLMAVLDANGDEYFIYPYFSPEPRLSVKAALLGLWVINETLIDTNLSSVRLLDVIRGNTFSIDKYDFTGSEESEFRERYQGIIDEWEALRTEYD